MRRRVLLPFFFLVASTTLARPSFAAAVGGEEWLTLPTGHFRIHFTAPQEAFAREFARHLERALPALEEDLGWRPRTPIDIVVNDRSDSPNGLAVSFPNTHIEVWPVPFPVETSLGDYTNWVEELAIHELTHIVANDTTRGAWSGLRSIFGSVVKPNGLQPSWLVEGLAVYFETRFTDGGRGRSPLTEAVLRSAIRNRLFDDPSYLTLDRLNEGPFWWPDGHTPYLVGYALQASLALPTDTAPFPGAFSQKNAARFPWTPNVLLEEMKGFEWSEAWRNLGEKLRARWPGDASKSACWISRGGAFTGGQALSPDGRVYFSLSDATRGHWLARVSPGCEAEPELLFERDHPGSPQVAVSPDGGSVVFTEGDVYRTERYFWDLWLWRNGSAVRLTSGLRAFDPAFLPDGRRLVFLRNLGDGRQSLDALSLDAPGQPENLFTAKPFERLSHPSAQGNSVFFTRHFNDGREEIWRLDLPSRKAERVTGLQGDRQRNPQPLGDDALLYSSWSRKSNTWSLWRRDRSGASHLVARSESGYLGRAVATPSGIVAVDYHPGGFDLRLLRAEEFPSPETTDDFHRYLTGEDPVRIEERAAPTEAPSPYSPTSTAATSLWPQYWLPHLTSALDGTLLGATTSGNDPLRYHNWAASLQYDTRAPFPTWNAFYSNRSTGNVLRLHTRQWNNWFSSTRESNREEMHLVDLSIPADRWAFSFVVAETTCAFGAKAGDRYDVAFRFTPAAGGEVIRER
ncbi:MAG: PD40 domain-containing protein, partial [Bdellovibrionales bacterium]|nr:PD40 domain-containing protein [Bdellovibrionales bacterium]